MRRDNFSKWIRSAKASQYSMLFLVFLFPFLFTSADFENQTVQPVFFEVSDDGTLVDNVEYHMIKNNLSCEEETEPELIMEYVEQPVQSVFFEVSDDGTLIGSSNKINFSLPLNGTLADLIKQLTPPAKKEKFKIGSLIKDKSGKTPDADIIFINKENGKISTGNEEIEEGKYEIKIKPKNHPISELTILDADVNKNLSGLVEIDEIPAGYFDKGFQKIYAVNPKVNDTKIKVKSKAVGTALYKCADYSFQERTCNGEWVQIKKLIPGEEYEFYMDANDPAFGEGSNYFTLVDIVIDGDMSDWDPVIFNPHNFYRDGVVGVDDLDHPASANRDGTRFAFTWNDTSLFFFIKRTSSGNNAVTFLVYLDKGNDGYMNYGDEVFVFKTSVSSTYYDASIYDYVPNIPAGDLILGDGHNMNGTITNGTVLQTNVYGIDESKIRQEAALNWSTLNLTAGSPLRMHVSVSSGLNLPSQIEDNFKVVSTQLSDFNFEPDREGFICVNSNITYNHTITNLGNVNDTYDLTPSGTLENWTVEILYANGTHIMDTDGDGLNDTGPIAPNQNKTILVRITPYINATCGTHDTTIITANSSVDSGVSRSVTDTTHLGALFIYSDNEADLGAGYSVTFNHTVKNNQIFSDVIDIINISSHNYPISYYYLNGTPLTDTNGDGYIDVGNLTGNESTIGIFMKVYIPPNASIGTVVTINVYANSSADPSIFDYASDTITVVPPVEIEPPRASPCDINSFVFYSHYVHNNQNFTDTFNLDVFSPLGWTTELYDEDRLTLLSDTNGDSISDTGPIGPYGETKLIYMKVYVPADAFEGIQDNETINATSVLNISIRDNVTDNTTAERVLIFEDASRTKYNRFFTRDNITYAGAFGLVGIRKVYFVWIDPNATVRRTSPDIEVDALNYAEDQYTHNYSSLIGAWTVIVYNVKGSVEISRRSFWVNGPLRCGDIIYTDNATEYFMSSDISGNGTCLTLLADNITINCYGHTITGNTSGYGIYVPSYNTREIKNCTIQNFTAGIRAVNSYYNSFYNNTLLLNLYGLYLENSGSNNIYDSTIHSNTYGYYLLNSTGDNLSSIHFYNNDYDFKLNSTSQPFSFNATNLIFDNPSDEYINYTNISFDDSLPAYSSYTINWSAPPAYPPGYAAPGNKFINITNLTSNVSIENAVWYWNESDVNGYSESSFQLWVYNSTGWHLLNSTPNTASNLISYSDFAPSGVYGILVSLAPNVTLNYPPDNYTVYTSPSQILFNCSATAGVSLKNISLYITNSTNQSFSLNQTSNISGTYNESTWLLNLTEGTYTWNCIVYDTSNNSDWGDANRTVYVSTVNYSGCVNLSNSSTYQGKIVNLSGTFYINSDNITLCTGTYSTNKTLLVFNTSNSVLDCNGSILSGDQTSSDIGIDTDGQSNLTVENCTIIDFGYGIFVNYTDNSTFKNNTIENNTNTGIRFGENSSNISLSINRICFNNLDLINLGSINNGSLDSCDSFTFWYENNHKGCTYSCSSLWHRFFGNGTGTIILGHNETWPYVYAWNSTRPLNFYFADYDSQIEWHSLYAIGKNISGENSTNDFIELDNAFNSTIFTDNINDTYSTEGSSPKQTQNYSVYNRWINSVPVANSTTYDTSFQTGIMWDSSDGGTEYSNTYNQSTVWVVKANKSTADAYGTYDYLSQVPYTLSTYEGTNDVISVYLEVE